MAINAFKFIATTEEKVGPNSVDIELNVTSIGGWEQVVSQTANGVKETNAQFPAISDSEFTLSLFELYVSSMDSETSKLLLKSVEIVGLNGSTTVKTLSIPSWPQNKWLGKISGSSASINLGSV